MEVTHSENSEPDSFAEESCRKKGLLILGLIPGTFLIVIISFYFHMTEVLGYDRIPSHQTSQFIKPGFIFSNFIIECSGVFLFGVVGWILLFYAYRKGNEILIERITLAFCMIAYYFAATIIFTKILN